MAHLDPDLLALTALGENSGPQASGHLAGCADCRGELRQLAAVVAAARAEPGPAQLAAPPPALWARVAAAAGVDPAAGAEPAAAGSELAAAGSELAAAGAEPVPWLPTSRVPARTAAASGAPSPPGRDQAAGAPRGGSHARGPWWRRRPVAAALAGLAAGLVLGAGAAVAAREIPAGPAARVVASIPLRALPQFPQWRGAHGTAQMAVGPHGRQLSVALSAPRRPGFYEVWLLARNGTAMISLGDLGPGHTGRFTMPPGVDLANYSRIDVSLQAFDGSPLHSRSSVVRGQLP